MQSGRDRGGFGRFPGACRVPSGRNARSVPLRPCLRRRKRSPEPSPEGRGPCPCPHRLTPPASACRLSWTVVQAPAPVRRTTRLANGAPRSFTASRTRRRSSSVASSSSTASKASRSNAANAPSSISVAPRRSSRRRAGDRGTAPPKSSPSSANREAKSESISAMGASSRSGSAASSTSAGLRRSPSVQSSQSWLCRSRTHWVGARPGVERPLLKKLWLSSNGCGWVEARSAGRRGVLAARVASELTAHGVHLTGGGRGAPWPGVGRSGVAAGRPACQRATRVLRCATALRVTHRPSLRSSSRYGPCGPAWTGASRPSTTTRKARRLAVRG